MIHQSGTTIWEKVARAHTDADLAKAERLVTRFRVLFTEEVEERGWSAVCLAAAYFGAQQFGKAEVWALRSLRDIPRRDSMCLLGELAWLRDDVESAMDWYTAAGAIPSRLSPELDLASGIWDRRDEFLRLIQIRPIILNLPQPHAVFVLTVPGRETFQRTMASLEEARAPSPRVVCDERREGQAPTFFRALRQALETGAENFTIVEDDAVFVKNAFEYIQRVSLNELMLVSWYSTSCFPFRSQRMPALVTYAAKIWSGAPAITLPRHMAERILNSEVCRSWSTPHQGDAVFGRFDPDGRCAVHYPNLVDHISLDSLTGNTGLRPSPTFPEEDFDARRLIT